MEGHWRNTTDFTRQRPERVFHIAGEEIEPMSRDLGGYNNKPVTAYRLAHNRLVIAIDPALSYPNLDDPNS